MKYKVLYQRDMDAAGKQILWDNDCEVIISKATDEAGWIKEIAEYQVDAIMTRVDPVTAAMMDASKNMKAVAKQGAGLDNIDLKHATEKGIQVVFAPAGNSNSVAEHTMLLMLACGKRFTYVDRNFRAGNFDIRYGLHELNELEGKTLGLLGCGRIGQMIANKAAHGFGMKVIGFDPFLKPEQLQAPIELLPTKEEVEERADFISLHMPLLPTTARSIGAADFARMKKTAIFLNCARGPVVAEDELIAALKSGEIAGAGLDVFEHEPFSYENELLKMDNVVLTPHMAGTTDQAITRCAVAAATGLVEVFTGKKVTFPANKLA